MIIMAFLFAFGIALLLTGAHWLIEGGSNIADRLNVSRLFIGLTIVAFGTSAPEFMISVTGVLKGSEGIALGNVLGSYISNILLILGISAAIYPIAIQRATMWKEIPLSLLAAILVGLMASDTILDGIVPSLISRTDGFILLSFFIIFLYYTVGVSKEGVGEVIGDVIVEHKERSLPVSIELVAFGLLGLFFGGYIVVESAISLAREFGVSDSLIGLTIVAVGTSVPELATCIVAARKKENDIIMGNIIGSNIFNIFFVLGATAAIRPLQIPGVLFQDVAVTIGSTVLLLVFIFTGKKYTLARWQGIAFVFIYIAYVIYLVAREGM